MVTEITHFVVLLMFQCEIYSCITGCNQPEHILWLTIFHLGKNQWDNSQVYSLFSVPSTHYQNVKEHEEDRAYKIEKAAIRHTLRIKILLCSVCNQNRGKMEAMSKINYFTLDLTMCF